MTTTIPVPSNPADLLGEPQRVVIPREGDRDLAFEGWLLSRAEERREGYLSTGVEVSIYLTKGKRFVTHVRRWRARQGEEPESDHHAADHYSANSALAWLKDDDDGRLGPVSKRAWVEACSKWPDLGGQEVEFID